eukprot:EG_transcript_21412
MDHPWAAGPRGALLRGVGLIVVGLALLLLACSGPPAAGQRYVAAGGAALRSRVAPAQWTTSLTRLAGSTEGPDGRSAPDVPPTETAAPGPADGGGALRFFYAPAVAEPAHILEGEELQHLVRVLRARVGDVVALTDGRGGLFEGVVAAVEKRQAGLETRLVRRDPRPQAALTLVVAPPRSADRFDWLLEKATEFGAAAIAPVWTARSERRVARPERWERILVAALKQSQRTWLPDLQPARPFAEVVAEGWAGAQAFIAHCGETAAPKPLLQTVLQPGRPTWVAVGPEGDFTAAEVRLAVARG